MAPGGVFFSPRSHGRIELWGSSLPGPIASPGSWTASEATTTDQPTHAPTLLAFSCKQANALGRGSDRGRSALWHLSRQKKGLRAISRYVDGRLPARQLQCGDQLVGRLPAAVDADFALDLLPLLVGHAEHVHGLPGHRGRPVELPQGFGDGRTLDLQHRDGGVHLGQDFDRDQVGKLLRLGHGSTSCRRTAQPTSAFRPSLTSGSTGRLRSRASWTRRLTSLAAWVTSTSSTCRRRVRSLVPMRGYSSWSGPR